MHEMTLVYDHSRLHITDDSFYIVPLQPSADIAIIDRITNEIRVERGEVVIPPTSNKCKEIFGIFGIIKLVNGPNLIVITQRELVGLIAGKEIWRILKFEIIPYRKSNSHLNDSQKSDLATYSAMLDESLDTQSFYYSSTFDLTHTIQRINLVDNDFFAEDLCSRADQRFVWNLYALTEFMEQSELHQFAIPVMHGMVKIVSCFVKGRTFDIILISRRSNRRAGTRYYVRGVDDSGDVANFVETEQIVSYGQYYCSIVQTRGSIPLLWSQFPNIKYKPKPNLSGDATKHQQYFKRHIDSQVVLYGKQYALNLVNQHGSENVLARAFQQVVDSCSGCKDNVSYEAFDFHHVCGTNKWHRLSLLMDKIELSQTEFGYFMMAADQILMKQTGVFRTNCMDCLDRTNVVQSLIARRSLTTQLIQLGILSSGETIEQQESLNYTMRNIWADNADYCSIQYAGTGALKTDYTRTGKRTVVGMLRDGLNSAVRYWKNNFQDGFRQDSIDLLLGNFVVSDQVRSPFMSNTTASRLSMFTLTYILFSLGIMFYFQSATGAVKQYSLIALWGFVTMSMARYVVQRGTDFVNSPLLFHAKSKQD